MKAEPREEPFVPEGDSPGWSLIPVGGPHGSKGWAQIAREKGRPPSGEEIVFDPDYEPLLFSERDGCSLRGGCSRPIA